MFYLVHKNEEVVITGAHGKYVRTVTSPGLHIRRPFTQAARHVDMRVSQFETIVDVKTKDNVYIAFPVSIQTQVVDSRKAYNCTTLEHEAKSRVVRDLMFIASQKDFLDLCQDRRQISAAVCKLVTPETEELDGLKIVDVVFDAPQIPQLLRNSLLSVREQQKNAMLDSFMAAVGEAAKSNEQRAVEAAAANKENALDAATVLQHDIR